MHANVRTPRRNAVIPPLPLHMPDWKPWKSEMLRRIHEGCAQQRLDTLVQAGCDRDGLLFRLAAIVAWQGRGKKLHWSATGLSRHLVKEAPKKIREVADLLGQFDRVLPSQIEELPALLAELRARADELVRNSRILLNPSKRTLEVAALASLVGYVKRATGRNYDEAVTGLTEAVTRKVLGTPLAQWRSKHREDIALLGSGVVNPLLVPIPHA